MKKNREERYQSADEMLTELRELKKQLQSGAINQASTHSEATPKPSGTSAPDIASPNQSSALLELGRRYRRWLLVVAVVAFLAAVLDMLLFNPQGGGWVRDAGLLVFAVACVLGYVFLQPKVVSPSSLSKAIAFRGLLPFQEADRDRFFGREMETSALFDLIVHYEFRFGVLFGDSGSGKTSLIKAGLLPKLRQASYMPVYCRPYKDPLATLLEECRRLSQIQAREGESSIDYLRRVTKERHTKLVIICDQFEEFFVNFKTRRERKLFVSFVAECYHAADLPVKFFFSMRHDFLDRITEFDGLIPEPLMAAKRYHLHNFDEEQAAEVIEKSVRRANLPIEATLCRQVVRDLVVHDPVKSDSSVLPSELQIIGEQLQSKRIFTLHQYRRAGGKEPLVHSYLEDIIQESGDREAARLIIRSLISDEDTRLTLTLREIVKRTQLGRETVKRNLRLFVESRLICEIQKDEPWRYELMHEYLIGKVNQVTGKMMDATQRANRQLKQYASQYTVDKSTRIPLGKLWLIKRYANVKRDGAEQE
ncbi:MAG: ATP-binding protein, partial [Acidobacteriota bacterium]|nr:ATP-binding protein [Acidobacteriota bacterium]